MINRPKRAAASLMAPEPYAIGDITLMEDHLIAVSCEGIRAGFDIKCGDHAAGLKITQRDLLAHAATGARDNQVTIVEIELHRIASIPQCLSVDFQNENQGCDGQQRN